MALPPEHVQREITARLVSSANLACGMQVKLTGALLAALGASLALIISNLEHAQGLIDLANLKSAIKLYVVMFSCFVAQRALSMIVESAAAAIANGRALDPEDFTAEERKAVLDGMAAAYFPPMSWIIRPSFRKMAEGNIIHFGRAIAITGQLAAFMVPAQVFLAAWSILIIAQSLG